MFKSMIVSVLLSGVGAGGYLAGGGHLPALPTADTAPPAAAAPAAAPDAPGAIQVIATCEDPQDASRADRGPGQARKASERTVTVRVPQAAVAAPSAPVQAPTPAPAREASQGASEAAPAATPQAPAADPAAPTAGQGGVNLNTATAAELEALPGIGAKTADRIVASRPFAKVEDVKALPGVTGPNYALLAPHAHV